MRIKTFSAHETTQLAVVVRVKTFSTHVVPQIHRVVSKSGLFTHEKILQSMQCSGTDLECEKSLNLRRLRHATF